MNTIKEAVAVTGSLSVPEKMPGFAYGIPPQDCKLGAILRKKKGSVCSKCYAHKGMYSFPVVRAAQAFRLRSLKNLPLWTTAMTLLIGKKLRTKEKFFRWHDSGDVQSLKHISAIVTIAKNLPDVRFWLPSKERSMIRAWIKKNGRFPENLVVRMSSAMLGQKPDPIPGTLSSTVDSGIGHACPAYSQGGHCGDCRACWDPTIDNVDYPQH
jgi:hypothetical protein